MLCIGCLLAGLAADRFGASRTFIVGSLLLAAASWAFYHFFRRQPAAAVSAVWDGGAVCRRGGGGTLRNGARFPGGSAFYRHLIFPTTCRTPFFGGLTPIAVTMLMGVSPMAPARYVLALSLMGLGLGYLAASGG